MRFGCSDGGSCEAYLWNLPHLESLIDPPSIDFSIPPLGGKMHLNYQDPDSGVLSYSGYGVRGIYIYIAIIANENEKAV